MAVRVLGASRGRGRRRGSRPCARGRARDYAGGRQGDEPAGARGPDRGRERPGPRPRPARGDPGPRTAGCVNASFTDYLLPTILDMPPVRIEVLEHADPDGAVRPEGRRRAAEHLDAAAVAAATARRDGASGRADSGPARPSHPRRRSRVSDRRALLAVARGDAEPDLVIEGARVFSAFTKEWLDGDVAICGSRIVGVGRYEGGRRLDGFGTYLVPGFIDAHVHIESSKLAPAEFARAVVPRGTTTRGLRPARDRERPRRRRGALAAGGGYGARRCASSPALRRASRPVRTSRRRATSAPTRFVSCCSIRRCCASPR